MDNPIAVRCDLVLHVEESVCEVRSAGARSSARFAPHFPTPRTERVSPGHLVALATAADGSEVVVWRWYDAVVLDASDESVRLWEPAHGEVLAVRRRAGLDYPVGSRAYASAGLPGADWWVCGPVVSNPADAEVDLDEVVRLYTDNDLWGPTLA